MSKRLPKHGGILRWDTKNKLIYQSRSLNPPSFNARFQTRLKEEYPGFTLVEEWKAT